MNPSSSFCSLPFQHLYINNGGYLNTCYSAYPQYGRINNEGDATLPSVLENGIRGSFESAFFQSIRQKMVTSLWPKVCNTCQKSESLGLPSPRQKDMLDSNDSIDLSKIYSFDLRLGNICNLKCRMCSPFSSDRLSIDWKDSANYSMREQAKYYENLNWKNWSEDKVIWNELFELSGAVRNIHFAGGEPFLNREHVVFLKKLISSGRAPGISLSYNTNLSLIPSWLEKIVSEFRSVTLNISIDGYNSLNEFIRYPSKWTNLVSNLNQLDRHNGFILGNLRVDFTTTIQIYNILYLDDLLNFLSQQTWSHIPKWTTANFLYNPSYYSAAILPESGRQLAKCRLEKVLTDLTSNFACKNIISKSEIFCAKIVKFLDASPQRGNISDFRSANTSYDEARNQDYFLVAPEMQSFLL
jgi:MoaA/NifB/PqqE/SkfB family radical SAM enzyme